MLTLYNKGEEELKEQNHEDNLDVNNKDSEYPEYSTKVKVLLELPNEHTFHKSLREELDSNIIGQEKAKESLINSVVSGILSFGPKKGTLGCLFFAGPTGVGKTQMVKALAKALLGNEEAYTKIPCENYQEHHTTRNLFGAPKSYTGYRELTPLSHKNIVKHYDIAKDLGNINDMIISLDGFSIILFDEIEKAHPNVHQSLLGLMDEGKIDFNDGKTVNYGNCIIIMTSNLGQAEITNINGRNPIGFIKPINDEKETNKIFKKAMADRFSPEFLNRITKVVEFEYLTEKDCKQIIGIHTKVLNAYLGEYYPHSDISIEIDDSCYEYILDRGFSKKKGARELIRVFTSKFESKLNILLHSDGFSQYFNYNGPIVISMEVLDGEVQFYLSYYEESEAEKKGEDKNNDKSLPIVIKKFNKSNSALKELNNIYSDISQYVELYYINMDGDIDFRKEISEMEIKLQSYGFSNEDFLSMRNRSYIEAIDDLNFIETFNGINIFPYDKKEVFSPYSQRIIMKIVKHMIEKHKYEMYIQNFGASMINHIAPIIMKLLKVNELNGEQIQEIIIYIKKVLTDNQK